MSEKTPEARRSAALEKALAGEVRNVASAGAGGGAEGERVTRAVIYPGDCLTTLRSLPDGAARCCVTSPPYWGLRDYGVAGQLGLEPTPDAYVAGMVEVFRDQYGREPRIEAIHAGVECGLLSGKMPGLDCVSVGPDLTEIHTPRERMSISSVQRVWAFVVEVLKRSR